MSNHERTGAPYIRRDEQAADCAKAPMAAREAAWSEIPLEVKIERMRAALLRLENAITVMGKISNDAFKVAHQHEHSVRGRVLIEASRDPWGSPANTIIGHGFDIEHIFRPLK